MTTLQLGTPVRVYWDTAKSKATVRDCATNVVMVCDSVVVVDNAVMRPVNGVRKNPYVEGILRAIGDDIRDDIPLDTVHVYTNSPPFAATQAFVFNGRVATANHHHLD